MYQYIELLIEHSTICIILEYIWNAYFTTQKAFLNSSFKVSSNLINLKDHSQWWENSVIDSIFSLYSFFLLDVTLFNAFWKQMTAGVLGPVSYLFNSS